MYGQGDFSSKKGSYPSHPLPAQILFHLTGLGVCVMVASALDLGALDSGPCFTTNMLCDLGQVPFPL